MDVNILNVIEQSANKRLVLKIIYTEKDGTSEGWRYVEPYSFSNDDGETALFAWDRFKNGIRRFTIRRINQAEVSNDHFVPRYPIKI